jgi:uncharacterized protein
MVNDASISDFSKVQGIKHNLTHLTVEENKLRISYEKHDVQIDLATGKGKIEEYKTTPVL